MTKKTDPNEVYQRIQTRFDFNKKNMSQSNLEEFLTAGRSDGITTSGITELAVKLEAKAINDLKPMIDVAETPDEIEEIKEIKIEQLQDRIKERIDNVANAFADTIRTTGSLEEFEEAIETLRKIAPRKLGGLKTQQILRARRALRTFGG